jgi:hypothetical protein
MIMEKSKGKVETIAPHVIGNVGLYYVCYRLSCQGWNVMPTARNAKGVDVLIYNHDASRKLSIQVKALSKRNAVPLGTKLEHFFADFIVVCRYVLKEKPECFILTPAEVRALAVRQEKDGRVSLWLAPRAYEAEDYREAWERIGLGVQSGVIPLPPNKSFEPTAS